MTTSIDPRGIKRGSCNTCNACESYELVVGEKRSNCAYCGHPAPDHENLGKEGRENQNGMPRTNTFSSDSLLPLKDLSVTFQNSFDTSDSSLGTPSSSDNSASVVSVSPSFSNLPVIELAPTVSVDDFLNGVVDRSFKTSQGGACADIKTDDVPMPESLPHDLHEVFVERKKDPGDAAINKMVRCIVAKITDSGMKPTPQLFSKAAKKACNKWSPLKVRGDDSHAGMALKIRRRYLRFGQAASKSRKSADKARLLTVQDTLVKMREDWENNLRTPSLMLQHMETVREYRIKVVTKEAAGDHLRLYPALRLPPVLMRELEVKVETTYITMKDNWMSVLPKLIDAMVEENLFPKPADTTDTDELTILVLQNLHRVKVWHKEKKDREGNIVESDPKSYVLQIFPEGTPIAEVWARNRDPPRLMGMEMPDGGKVSLFCFVDTEPLFSITDATQAMCLLLATFYAFHISWTPKAKFPLYLLICAVLGPDSRITPSFSNNSKFVAYLRKIGIRV